MIDIYLCVTLYHLYVSLLYIEEKNNKQNSVILLDANDAQIYSNFEKYAIELRRYGFQVDLHLRSQSKNVLGLEPLEAKKQFKRIEKLLGRSIGNEFNLYNFAWNCEYAYSIATYYIKRCKKLFIVEEGAQTAFVPKQPWYKVLIKRITGSIVDFYKMDKLEGIYLQKPEIYPEKWEKKKKLDLNKIENALTTESKKQILRIFMGELYERFEEYDFSNTGIIYTQALSEDGYISENQKIDYYSQMVNYYSAHGAPILKLHPRDKTQYPFAENVLVLPASIPSEVLGLMGICFKYAVAICSSAVLTTNAIKKINLNENFNNDKIFMLIPMEENR